MTQQILTDRVTRLTGLLDRLSAIIPQPRLAVPAADAVAALDRLVEISTRLPDVAREIDTRRDVAEWDALDRFTARLLLEQLAAALAECRLIVARASDRLGHADNITRVIGEELDIERDRAARDQPR